MNSLIKKLIAPCVAVLLICVAHILCAEEARDKVCFMEHCFSVEVVQTLSERTKGLQHRTSLARDAGMLFIFEESRKHVFWMKDTLISLDMIWIDHNKKIVSIASEIPPCTTPRCPTYGPDSEALYVLEVNAGVVSELGLKVNDQAVFTTDEQAPAGKE